MTSHHHHRRRVTIAAAAAIGAASAGLVLAAPAGADTSAHFVLGQGVLTIVGDDDGSTIVVGRDADGVIDINGGAVHIRGARATVANVDLIKVIGGIGNDALTIDETNGAMPAAAISGGAGNDRLAGGAGSDQLLGGPGTDVLFGNGGEDRLVGGDGDDLAFGGAGDDQLVWNPGDDSDGNEGGDGNDTVQVFGGDAAETFTATPNGTRVRFDRVSPAPFALDIGTSEQLVLDTNGGDDTFSASNGLATLIQLTVNGGAGNDTLQGGNGADKLIGGDGDDFVDGNGGNDIGLLGAGNDTFQWDPGDGSDTVEGQDGLDTLLFNGSNAAESMDVSANGQRVRFFRNVGTITMDLDGVERVDTNALGSADEITVNDLSGTDLTDVNVSLASVTGSGDEAPDSVIVNGTNAADAVTVTGSQAAGVTVSGLHATVRITGTDGVSDALTVKALDGDDLVDAHGLAGGAVSLRIDGGNGADVLVGSAGDDTIAGGADDDLLIGGPGQDALDGGPGANVLIQ